MREIDKRAKLSRRRFLATSGATAAGIGAVSAGMVSGGMVLVDPRGAWAMSLTTLRPETAKALVQMARDLYPHDRLGEAYYAKAVESHDAAASKDPKLADLFATGADALDGAARGKGAKSYVDLPGEAERVAILKSIEGTPFFAKFRGDMIVALYNQPEVWKKFGYEGPSAEEGGYLHRGFDDIDWLKA
jgi:hypothetical protein